MRLHTRRRIIARRAKGNINKLSRGKNKSQRHVGNIPKIKTKIPLAEYV